MIAADRAAPDHDRRRPVETRLVGGEIDRDPLAVAERAEQQLAVEPAAGDREAAGEGMRIEAQRSARPGPRNVERGDLDDRRPARRQQDRAGAGERPQSRAALGAPAIARRAGLEAQHDIGQAECVDRTIEPQGKARPLEPPFEAEPRGPVIGMPRHCR